MKGTDMTIETARQVSLDVVRASLRGAAQSRKVELATIERALKALNGGGTTTRRRTKTKRHFSAATRRKMSLSQKARWAKDK